MSPARLVSSRLAFAPFSFRVSCWSRRWPEGRRPASVLVAGPPSLHRLLLQLGDGSHHLPGRLAVAFLALIVAGRLEVKRPSEADPYFGGTRSCAAGRK